MTRQFVRQLLLDEAFAYGFTIAFWGSGVLLIRAFGLPGTPGVFAYALGAVSGFAVLAALTFGSATQVIETDTAPEYVLLSAIHYLAALVPIAATHVLVTAPLPRLATFFLSGGAVSTLYNLSATVEELLSERLRQTEQRFGEDS
ncbi:hypothetical protein [Haloglomus litoreum]|uniref:hypothetical protein n=1 Tax=Haloglomus litoreum TaxID=3034026 RepID=UPI0023E75F1B|nr:hypothetical protein [Haloglomus sp. DT116]